MKLLKHFETCDNGAASNLSLIQLSNSA